MSSTARSDARAAAPPRPHRGLARSLAVVGLLSGVSLAACGTDDGPGTPAGAAVVDDFDRPNNDASLGSSALGEWRSVAGLWMVDAGKAIVGYPADDATLTVVGSIERPRVTATITGSGRCGIVGRFVDERNYVALELVPQFGVWNLVSMRDGEPTRLGTLAASAANASHVGLELGDRGIVASVDDRSITVDEPPVVEGGRAAVGLIGQGRSALDCTWDDVRVVDGP